MSTVHDPMREIISLHGLGFIQVQLQGDLRLHVWHPELPRRRCYEHSAIHDHRFDFESLVLIGEQINIDYEVIEDKYEHGPLTHTLYVHEGARTQRGGRPWVPNAQVRIVEENRTTIPAGESYRMRAYNFHRTEPGGDGKVATVMQKLCEYPDGATSSCLIGVEPDTDFDRFQLSPAALWSYVLDVLGGDHQSFHDARALEILRKVEQMAAYYEAPKGFFDWVDFQLAKLGAAPNTAEPAAPPHQLSSMLDAINQRMNSGRCPTAGSLGECAAIDQVVHGIYEAYLYIWNHEFNDSATVAGWFHEAGAESCTVSLTLYSDVNGDRDGRAHGGCREWVVTYTVRQATATGSPEGLLPSAQEGGA